MSAAVLPFPARLGRRAWAVSEQATRPAAPASTTLYARQSGRVFFLSPRLEDLAASGEAGCAFTIAAPRLGQGGPRESNERTWRAWLIGWCDQRGLEALFFD